MKNTDPEKCGAPVAGKARYQAPRLTAYGSLKERTRAGEFFGNDGNTECTGNANAAQQPCIS